ncbi:sigma-E factor regulatory protein RseB domain-containing protein [Halomonas ramblicola]|uniref:sigma-E factor regulatory protein RseB domain-containing protein n=1 Tax=Halomonas ramblicola TaxID=747349 RepID=UPI0025B440DF|nr:sigma-E factor regulatory protein RseB domain-containing protein [Halomonas ramblicola]MDN3520663.1 sigma-E factor regulatory protein RseB domain-containing protein [Halomonas ramblicola]
MLAELLIALALAQGPDPIAEALARFEALAAYQATLHGQGPRGEEVIRYSYRHPGHIRLDMVTPQHGAVLVYSPETRRVRVWPFGAPGPNLSLRPTHRLVRSARGHRVDQSDLGSLLRNVQRLQWHGELRDLGEARIGEHEVRHLAVQGAPGHAVDDIARYELWLDAEHGLPRRVVSLDRHGRELERVRLEDLVLDPELPPDHFSP